MEKRLFNTYLDYLRKQNLSIGKRLSKLPMYIKVQLIATFIALFFSLLLSITAGNLPQTDSTPLRTILIIVYMCLLSYAVIQSLFTYRSVDKFEIENSHKNLNEYWDYCKRNRAWFSNEMGIMNTNKELVDENILIVKERIDKYILKLENAIEKRSARMERIIQALAIPFVLAIITSIVDKHESVIEAVAIVVSIILIMTMMFGFFWLFNNTMGLIRKHKVEQLKVFSEDLQGMWDYANIFRSQE